MSEISRFLARWIFPAVLMLTHIVYWTVMLKHANFFTPHSFFLDFDTYRHLLCDAITGINPYTVTYMQTLGPPHVMFVYIPFLLFPLHLSQFLFFLVNTGAFYAAAQVICLSMGKTKWRHVLLWSLILLIPFPTRFSLLMGQPGGLSALLVALLVTSTMRWVQAVSLLLLCTLKAFYVIVLAAFPLKRVRAVVVGLVLLTVASFSVFVPHWYGTYLRGSFVHTITAPTGSTTLDYYNQSVRSTLTRLHLEAVYPWVMLGLCVAVVLLLVSTHDCTLAVLCSLLVSPIIWQHYLVAIFPILLLAMLHAKRAWQRFVLVMLFLLLAGQFSFLHTAPVSFATGLLASHFFLGLVGLILYCGLLSPQAVRRLKTW